MARSNREILTGGKKYVQKQKAKHRVEEVVFDKDARKDYLTGFHKRKVARQQKAEEFHKEQARLAKIEERKKIKEERQQDIQKQLDQYNGSLKDLNGIVDEDESMDEEENDEWNGFDDNEGAEIEEDEEAKNASVKGILKRQEIYSQTPLDTSKDQVTLVTIESMDSAADNNIAEIAKSNYVDLKKSQEVLEGSIDRAKKYAVMAGVTLKQPKQKKKKFRYLTKSERRENVRKEKSKKSKKSRD